VLSNEDDSRKDAKHAKGKQQGADKSISTIHRRDAEYAEEILIAQSGDDDWAKPKRFKGDMFLFVVVSRQTKKDFSAYSASLRLIFPNALRLALCALLSPGLR